MIDEALLFVMPVVFAGVSVPCEYSRHNRPLVFATRRRWDMAVACAEGAASVDDAVCVVEEQLLLLLLLLLLVLFLQHQEIVTHLSMKSAA